MSLFGKDPGAKLERYRNSRKRRDAPIPPPPGPSNKILRTVNGQCDSEFELPSVEEVRNGFNELRQLAGLPFQPSVVNEDVNRRDDWDNEPIFLAEDPIWETPDEPQSVSATSIRSTMANIIGGNERNTRASIRETLDLYQIVEKYSSFKICC